MMLVGLLRRKMSLVKRLRNRRLMLGFVAMIVFFMETATTKAVRALEDCENDAGTSRSFPPNLMGWLVHTPKSSQLSPIQCLWEVCVY